MVFFERTRTWLRDRRYAGASLGRRVWPTRFCRFGAYNTEHTRYPILEHLFARVNIAADDVIVDVGCGLGRVLAFLLSQGRGNRMVGIELDPEIAWDVQRRLGRHPNVEIIEGDATRCLPPDGTVFYLYNPFNEYVMRRFNHALSQLPTADRLRVIYYNCLHLDVFQRDPAWHIDYFKVPGHNPAAILSLKPGAAPYRRPERNPG